jgi:hypothetical protein
MPGREDRLRRLRRPPRGGGALGLGLQQPDRGVPRLCRAVGAERLRNTPELIAFDSDKRYLEGEVVVKPNISAGARSTGRFATPRHAEALALIETIRESRRTAIVQGYLEDVDRGGETALVFIAGELSHEDLVVAGEADQAQHAFASEVMATVTARFGTPLYARVDIAADADERFARAALAS